MQIGEDYEFWTSSYKLFLNYTTFSRKTSSSEYWYWFLFILIGYKCALIADG